MWHASAASKLLDHEALDAIIRLGPLYGVGLPAAEWIEHRGDDGLKIVHVRRLLTPAEAKIVGASTGSPRDRSGTSGSEQRP